MQRLQKEADGLLRALNVVSHALCSYDRLNPLFCHRLNPLFCQQYQIISMIVDPPPLFYNNTIYILLIWVQDLYNVWFHN